MLVLLSLFQVLHIFELIGYVGKCEKLGNIIVTHRRAVYYNPHHGRLHEKVLC